MTASTAWQELPRECHGEALMSLLQEQCEGTADVERRVCRQW
jgi:hypothetical protein